VSARRADQLSTPSTPVTIAEIVRLREPMGDLGRFLIEDMSPEEEADFFALLEDA
jgi:hypothetical protein